jgi:predicted anti-sigma-YlaC factor YlaD
LAQQEIRQLPYQAGLLQRLTQFYAFLGVFMVNSRVVFGY